MGAESYARFGVVALRAAAGFLAVLAVISAVYGLAEPDGASVGRIRRKIR